MKRLFSLTVVTVMTYVTIAELATEPIGIQPALCQVFPSLCLG